MGGGGVDGFANVSLLFIPYPIRMRYHLALLLFILPTKVSILEYILEAYMLEYASFEPAMLRSTVGRVPLVVPPTVARVPRVLTSTGAAPLRVTYREYARRAVTPPLSICPSK